MTPTPSPGTMLLLMALQHKLMEEGMQDITADEAMEECITRGWLERADDIGGLLLTDLGVEAAREHMGVPK